MNTEASKKFIEMLAEAGYTARSYSGRGMYGDIGIGVTTDEPFKLIAEVAYMAGQMESDAAEQDTDNVRIEFAQAVLRALSETRQDSMGRSTIIYWPRVEWVENEDEFVCYRQDVNPHGETCVQMSPNDDYNWCDGCVQRMAE